MRTPRVALGSRLISVATISAALSASACAPEFEKLPRHHSVRGSLGAEVYKLLCRRTAGTELPDDLDGRDSAVLCLGDDASATEELRVRSANYPPALRALAQRRRSIVAGIDALAPAPLAHDLDAVMRSLIPFYGDPDPRVPDASHAMAAWLAALAQDPQATSALARQMRDGMVPEDAHNGILRALSASAALSSSLHTLLPALLDADLTSAFTALRTALALDFSEPSSPGSDDDNSAFFELRDGDSPSQFGAAPPLRSAVRDARAMPTPAMRDGQLAYPFVDGDGDGAADLSGDNFVLDTRFVGALPEPYPVLAEVAVARDSEGRACSITADNTADCSALLYAYSEDRSGSALSALVAEAARAAREQPELVKNVLRALPALLGASASQQKTYGAYRHTYDAGGGNDEPLLALTQAFTTAQDSALYDDSTAALTIMVDGERNALAAAIAPWLTLLAHTGPRDDAYPSAVLSPQNTFWDELLWEAERLSRRRLSRGGESAVEGLVRAVLGFVRAPDDARAADVPTPPATLSHAGALLALTTRYKDEWRASPHSVKKRAADEPGVIGAFVTPVDRSQPDAPLSCGRDGCGGPIAGSPFLRFQLPGQQCMVEHDAQRGQGSDCGSAGNQSILHRALGLMFEGYGRAQCNRPLSVGDLVDEALGDPCTTLDPQTKCSVDADCAAVKPASPDYACDALLGVCVARPPSARCTALRAQRDQDRSTLVFVAEQALKLDYVCPAEDPTAACHAFADKYPAAFIDPDGDGPEPTALQACHVLDLPDVGRVFGYALNADYSFTVPNPWARRFLEDIARAGPISDTDDALAFPDCGFSYRITDPRQLPPCVPLAARATRSLYTDITASVDTLGELVEYLLGDTALFATDADALALRPDPKVLTRVLFAAGPAEGVQLFDPLLIRGAPPLCTAAPQLSPCALSGPILPAGSCCIGDAVAPPLQYRMDTYFGATTFALEHAVAFNDGTAMSFLDVTRPIAGVFNRLDVDPSQLPLRADVEDTDYGLLRLGKLLATHYDSADNPVSQNRSQTLPWYRQQTGLVHYEDLLGDAMDDGSVDSAQTGPGGTPLVDPAPFAGRVPLGAYAGVVRLMQGLHTRPASSAGSAGSGLDALARGAALFLNPHAYCAGDAGDDRVLAGAGACASPTRVHDPLTFLSGDDAPCWNDGSCFDGSAAARPRRYLSPMLLARAAVGDLISRANAQPSTRLAFNDALVGGAQFLFESTANGFSQPRAVALVRALLRHMRSVWAEDRATGALAGNGAREVADLADNLRSPVVAAALTLLRGVGQDDALLDALLDLLGSALRPEGQRALIASLSELLELQHAEPVTARASNAFAGLFVANIEGLRDGSESRPELAQSSFATELAVLDVVTAADTENVLARFAQNLTGALDSSSSPAPIDRLADALVAVHRVDPSATQAYDAADIAQIASHIATLLRDEKHGVERILEVVRCATASPVPASCNR